MISLSYRFYYVYLFIVGFIVGGGLLYLILVNYSNSESVAQLIISVIVGAIFGTITLILYWIGLFFSGAFCGLLLAAIIVSQIDNIFVDWVLVLAFPLFGGLTVIVIQKFGVISSSSFMGGYAIVASIDFISKGEGGLALFFPRYSHQILLAIPTFLFCFVLFCFVTPED